MIVIVFAALLLGSCTRPQATPTPSATATPTPTPNLALNALTPQGSQLLPEMNAPLGLGGVDLPDRLDEMSLLFKRLPSTIARKGHTLQLDEFGPNRYAAFYGEVRADDCSPYLFQAKAPPIGQTAGESIGVLAGGYDWKVLGAGRDGSLVWVQITTTCSTDSSGPVSTVFAMSWGNVDSAWVFSAQADTLEDLDAMVTAFVSAARNARP